MNNDKYQSLFQKVKALAEKSENIRAVFLIGSCAREIESADAYSDIDFVVIANDIDRYITGKDWIEALGNPLFVWTDHEPGWASWDRRVLFDDFLESDFVLFSVSQLEQEWLCRFIASMLTASYETVVDKDDTVSLFSPFICSDISEISNEKILNEINDFFFHCNWIKKKIDRGALFVAHKCLNEHMKNKLLFMIECSAKARNGPGYNTWFEGRFIEKWADPEILERLEDCFGPYHRGAMLTALKNQIYLYKSLSESLCNSKGLDFPAEAVQKILDKTGL